MIDHEIAIAIGLYTGVMPQSTDSTPYGVLTTNNTFASIIFIAIQLCKKILEHWEGPSGLSLGKRGVDP